MTQRRLLLRGIGGALLAAPALIGTARAQSATLRVGDQRGGIQPLMEAAGVLNGLPYRLEWSQFAGAPMLLEALNAGAIDTGGIGDAPFTSAVAAGIPGKAVSAVRSGGAVTALVVPGDSPVHSLADLRGKTIATLRGQTGHFLVLAALEREGLPADAVRFAFIAPDAAKAAMARGAVDGWATWGPYISLAKVQDGAREIVNGDGLMSGQSYQMAADAAIGSKRAALSDFLRRLRLAREWGLANPEEQARVWSAQTGFPLPVGRDVVAVAATRTVAIDEGVVAAQQRVSDFFAAVKVIPRPHQVAPAFDSSFNAAVFAA
ncbi:ABC transporter substrate-binding protein [Roseomonas sp. WA12]